MSDDDFEVVVNGRALPIGNELKSFVIWAEAEGYQAKVTYSISKMDENGVSAYEMTDELWISDLVAQWLEAREG